MKKIITIFTIFFLIIIPISLAAQNKDPILEDTKKESWLQELASGALKTYLVQMADFIDTVSLIFAWIGFIIAVLVFFLLITSTVWVPVRVIEFIRPYWNTAKNFFNRGRRWAQSL